MFGVEVTEVEKAAVLLVGRGGKRSFDVLEILAVVLVVHSSVYILMSKEFENKWEIIRVEKELEEIFVFQDVFLMVSRDSSSSQQIWRDSRDNLNHFDRIKRTPETAFEVISRDRTPFNSSTTGSVPSSLSASWPFAIPLRCAEELGFVLFLPFSPSSGNPFGNPFWPF